MAVHEGLEAPAEAAVLADEAAPGGGQSGAAGWTTPGLALEKVDAGGTFEVPEIAPGRPVGHAHALDGLLQRAQPLDRFQELGASLAELDPIAEDHPELDPRTGFDRAAHGVSA